MSKINTKKIENNSEYENGIKCSRSGKMTENMTREELIQFIGMLDDYITSTRRGKND